MIKFNFTDLGEISDIENYVVFIDENKKLTTQTTLIDQKYHGIISKLIAKENLLPNKFGSIKSTYLTSTNHDIKCLTIVSLGKSEELNNAKLEELGNKIGVALAGVKAKSANIIIDQTLAGVEMSEFASRIGSGILASSYRFDQYFTKLKEEDLLQLQEVNIESPEHELAQTKFQELSAVHAGINITKDLVNQPPNKLYPESYADMIIDVLEPLDVSVEVLGEREMRNLGMHCLLGVAQGSVNEAKTVIMEYKGAGDDSAPLCFIGKGVTFDSGGLSLKPSTGMEDMKYDMAGSATVVGLIKTLAMRKAKVNVVGVVGLVENMPGGNAQKLGDVVTTMSGQTVEILNTDAEGRLVLADVMWYAQDRYKPKFMIDLATLTGAIVVALADVYAGIFSNNPNLSQQLVSAGNKTDERVWELPLDPKYDEMLKSKIADMQNIGNGRGAGSTTAAQFLKRFVKDDTPWIHIDIAGVAWNDKGVPTSPKKGASGYGVKLLNQLIQDYYESGN